MLKTERLDKFLSNQNIGSRKEVSALVKKGAVAVDGAPAKSADMKIVPSESVVTVYGKQIGYSRFIYIMMNKPKGVLSATEDSRSATVVDLVPDEMRRKDIFPAGRLDKNTTGLLIITDDGELAHRMLAPKSHVFKLYEAVLDAPVAEEDIAAFSEGVMCGSRKFLPAELWLENENDPFTARVKIREGKFHQIKRMFFECGKNVLELKRLSIGGLALDPKLEPGDCRILSAKEISDIFLDNLH